MSAKANRTRVLQDLAILKRIGSETRLRRNLGVPRAVFEACSKATPVGLQFLPTALRDRKLEGQYTVP